MDDLKQLMARVRERETSYGGRIFALPMRTKDVVTVEGSVLGGWRSVPKEKEEAAVLAARLLDAGTKRTGKEALRGRIADRGASLAFSVGNYRVFFDISCLPEDLPQMLKIAAECLAEPLFDTRELESSRNRLMSRIRNNAHSTGKQASTGFTRAIYDKKHPNYSDSDEERLQAIARISKADLRAFHSRIGRGGLVLSIVGDIDAERSIAAAEQAFSRLGEGTLIEQENHPANAKEPKPLEKRIYIPQKANIDVYMGTALALRYGEPLYRPTQLFALMLGDGSTGHLMKTVRDRDGLTYGVYAGLRGMSLLHDGHFRVTASFAPDLYERGVAAIMTETRRFAQKGITETALEARKDEMAGSYVVGLSTTGALANTLHTIGVRHQPLSQLISYPEQIRAVTRAQVKEAAAQIPLDKLVVAAAGTFEKKG